MAKVLTAANADPRQKDGALHMVGSLADILLKKPLYKGQMDQVLAQFVFPEFSSPFGHLRARACWVLHYFCNVKFKEESVLAEAVNLTQRALLTDTELPVKVETAVALQMLLSGQEDRAEKYVEPHIRPITLELLNIIRETENDEITTVMQKIVSTYTEQLMPVAVEICQHLVTTFGQVIGHDEESVRGPSQQWAQHHRDSAGRHGGPRGCSGAARAGCFAGKDSREVLTVGWLARTRARWALAPAT